MNDFEDQLKQARLAQPSEALDRRMQAAFAAAAGAPPPVRRPRRSWLWLAGGALGAAAAAALFLAAPPPPPIARPAPFLVVNPVAPQSRLLRQFLDPSASRRPWPTFVVTTTTQ